MAGKRGSHLRTVADVAQFVAKMIRETYRGDLDPALAGRLTYMCNILKSCLEASELEERIRKLEEQVQVTEKET